MVWDCNVIREAWSRVVRITSEVVGTPVPDTPMSCLLGIRPSPKGSKFRDRFIDLAMTLYKRQIAMHWKARSPPDTHTWTRVLLKWALAEATAMLVGNTWGTGSADKQTWDTYVHKLETRDDTRPP